MDFFCNVSAPNLFGDVSGVGENIFGDVTTPNFFGDVSIWQYDKGTVLAM